MPKKITNPIEPLRKSITKLQQQLMKAHQRKIAKLDKAISSVSDKIKKKQAQLSTIKSKKTTAATQRRQKSVQSDIIVTKNDLRDLKVQLSHAKAAYTRAKLLEKAEIQAIKLTKKPRTTLKKKTLRKKAIKKIIKAADSLQELLVPDLSTPVDGSKDQPKTLWKPKVEKIEPSQTPASSPSLDSDILIADEIVPPQEPEQSQIERPIKEETQEPKEDREEFVLPSTDTQTSSKAINSENTSSEVVEQTNNNEDDDTETAVITNWHTMPIVKKSDE